MKMLEITYQTEPADPDQLCDEREILSDEQDPNMKSAQERLKSLRQQKRDLQDAKKRQIANLDTQISQAQAYIDALKTRAARLKAGKTWF
jgi:DNA repair exonuclease SbcCD ATPase subunit